jgi:uncharacterized protein YdiU (UPF0061 family)
MQNIKVLKPNLLDILKKNRTKHKAEFEVAVKEYRAKVKLELATIMKKLISVNDKVEGKDKDTQLYLQAPKNYLTEYDRTIKMLEMDTEDSVLLDESEFERYVEDSWSWKGSFSATNSLYAGSMALGAAPRKKR